jgi:hypothetical protein
MLICNALFSCVAQQAASITAQYSNSGALFQHSMLEGILHQLGASLHAEVLSLTS